MKRTAGEEFAAIYGISRAANEELARMVNRRDSLTRPQSSWDPCDVGRTRLKRPSVGTQDREPLPAGEASAAGPAVPDRWQAEGRAP
jgi:hypothetical protein